MKSGVAGRSRRRSAAVDIRSNEDGFSVLSAVLTLFVISLVITVSVNVTISHLDRAADSADRISAYYLAEAGVQKALVELAKADYDLGALAPVSGEVETGTFSVEISRNGNILAITSTGTTNDQSRKLEVQISVPEKGTIFSGQGISLSSWGPSFQTILKTNVFSTGEIETSGEIDFETGNAAHENVTVPVPHLLTYAAMESYYGYLVQNNQITERTEKWPGTRWNFGDDLVVTENTHYLRGIRAHKDVIVPEGVTLVVDGDFEVRGNLVVDGILYIRNRPDEPDQFGNLTGEIKHCHEDSAKVAGKGLIVAVGNARVEVDGQGPAIFTLKTDDSDARNSIQAEFSGRDSSLLLYADGDISLEGEDIQQDAVLRTSLVAQGRITVDFSGQNSTVYVEPEGFSLGSLPVNLSKATIVTWKEL